MSNCAWNVHCAWYPPRWVLPLQGFWAGGFHSEQLHLCKSWANDAIPKQAYCSLQQAAVCLQQLSVA